MTTYLITCPFCGLVETAYYLEQAEAMDHEHTETCGHIARIETESEAA